MDVCVVANPTAAHQREWGAAFAAGMEKHGANVKIVGGAQDAHYGDVLALWSVRRQDVIANARARGTEVVILERGYIGNREEWASVSLGGELNGRAKFGPCQDNGERFRSIAALKPWNNNRGYGLILGQVPGDMSIRGVDIRAFYRRAAKVIKAYGFKAHFRPHPLAMGETVEGAYTRPEEPIEAALAGAAWAVTWNSNSAVEAAIAGVPVVAMDRGSMAWDVAGHSLELPHRPDREAWAAHLAWKQWRLEEVAEGKAWEALNGAQAVSRGS